MIECRAGKRLTVLARMEALGASSRVHDGIPHRLKMAHRADAASRDLWAPVDVFKPRLLVLGGSIVRLSRRVSATEEDA